MSWLDTGFPTPEMLDTWAAGQAALLESPMVVRHATWEDSHLLVDLCANAAETIGEWTVTVERGPNPYAQFRLQEQPSVTILEDRRVALGMAARSVRNTLIAGERTTAHFMMGWRVRDGFRGMGLSRLLQHSPGSGASWFGLVTYYFVRTGNASASWIDMIAGENADRPEGYGRRHRPADRVGVVLPAPGPGRALRPGPAGHRRRPPRCRELINRTHDGLDLFRPYSEEYLDHRMSDPCWGPKPSFYPTVYGLPDYRVLEIDGTIVACGGRWDRGRDLREVWRPADGPAPARVLDPTALMDFGFADGAAAAMGELIRHLLAETADQGRSGVARTAGVPARRRRCGGRPRTDHGPRALHVLPFASPDLTVQVDVTRPYIDLAYW